MSTSGSIAKRILQYLVLKDISEKSFAENDSLGPDYVFDKGRISKTISNNGKLQSDVVEKFLLMFPDVNPYWLLLGEGEALINRKLLNSFDVLETSYIDTLMDRITELNENINDLRGTVKDKEKIITLLETRI